MQIQLNTDNNIQGDDTLAEWLETELKTKLDRFRDHVTRIEVHLSDNSAGRHGEHDIRCKLEARLAGFQPVLVSHDAAKTGEAIHGAIDKLQRTLTTTLEKVRATRGRDSVRGAEPE